MKSFEYGGHFCHLFHEKLKLLVMENIKKQASMIVFWGGQSTDFFKETFDTTQHISD